MSEQEMVARREAATLAVWKAIYGDSDPFTNPEGYDFCREIADAIITTLAPADASDALKLAQEYADKRDWNGAYHAMRVAYDSASRTSEPVEAPENGETDPEWRAIRRAIDQFVGRVPVVSKHLAVHKTHLAETVAHLDALGEREAADTIVWQCWWRAIDRERERFLLADAASPTPSPKGAE